MEQSAIRDAGARIPDFALLHPGYALRCYLNAENTISPRTSAVSEYFSV